MIRLIALLAILTPVGVVWMLEDWWRRFVGLSSLDNCFTWAARNYRYKSTDGLLIHKSVSGWFPHFIVVRNAGIEPPPPELLIDEFIPVVRDPSVVIPKRKFVGKNRKTQYRKGAQHESHGD